MLATVEWDSVTHAGAFLLGAVLGTAAAIRIMRVVTNYFMNLERRDRE